MSEINKEDCHVRALSSISDKLLTVELELRYMFLLLLFSGCCPSEVSYYLMPNIPKPLESSDKEDA
jgi:hypothetical protein